MTNKTIGISAKQKLFYWMKQNAPGVVWQYRKATWRQRVLPDFLIVGAQKCGTRSLYTYLGQHPQILPSMIKEVNFFHKHYHKGQIWYRAHFPMKKNMGASFKTFEATPEYLLCPDVPERIYGLVPNAKIIILLRNPTERAISHYFHSMRKGRENLPIMEALLREKTLLEEDKQVDRILDRSDRPKKWLSSYIRRGLYRQQIERYLKIFPEKQILILNSEKFFSETSGVLKKIFEFIGVDTDYNVPDLKPRHVAKNKTEVDPEVYQYLDNYFQDHNQALYDLLGESYKW